MSMRRATRVVARTVAEIVAGLALLTVAVVLFGTASVLLLRAADQRAVCVEKDQSRLLQGGQEL